MGRCRGSQADRAGSDRRGQGRKSHKGERSLTPPLAWRLCALAGLATLAASFGFGAIPHLGTACGPTGGAGPITAFELVRSPADMLSLFGADPCRERMMTAQRAGLWHDMLAFIPAYTAFLALAAWALRGADRKLALAAMAMPLLAGLLDELEGVVLFHLLDDFPGAGGWFDALFWTVRPKFLLLGLGEIAIAALLVRGSWAAKIGAAPVAIGGAVSIWFLFADPRNALMMEGHRWAWTALLLVAILGAIRSALVMRPNRA